MKTKSSQALLSVGGAWREWACPALLIQMRSSMRPAFNGGPERHTTDSTMTAPSNTYDVIVVGGGISGRSNSSKLYFAVQGSQTNCTSSGWSKHRAPPLQDCCALYKVVRQLLHTSYPCVVVVVVKNWHSRCHLMIVKTLIWQSAGFLLHNVPSIFYAFASLPWGYLCPCQPLYHHSSAC